MKTTDPNIPELAFERFKVDDPPTLWRVVKKRSSGSRTIRCIEYFNDEGEAWAFVGRSTDRGHEVVRVDQFKRVVEATESPVTPSVLLVECEDVEAARKLVDSYYRKAGE